MRLKDKVAVVTGAASGIGKEIARTFANEGAKIVIADLNQQGADTAAKELDASGKRAVGVAMDVSSEPQVEAGMEKAIAAFGRLDILVSNAGIASAAPVEETALEVWNRNLSILATGYFLVSREAFGHMKRQGLPSSIVFVGSKNALVASPGASAYCTAKAAELHLARCLALEGAPAGIRVNVVNPDAVIRGSRIWGGAWRQERAASNRIAEDEVEDFYRKRSLLVRSVFPEDIAEAVYFFASDLSSKSTGNILNVDAGNLTAFTR